MNKATFIITICKSKALTLRIFFEYRPTFFLLFVLFVFFCKGWTHTSLLWRQMLYFTADIQKKIQMAAVFSVFSFCSSVTVQPQYKYPHKWNKHKTHSRSCEYSKCGLSCWRGLREMKAQFEFKNNNIINLIGGAGYILSDTPQFSSMRHLDWRIVDTCTPTHT